ncbi:toxin-antitoxin system HicB family antitoxin [Alterisphingorhabdus coralli]|uniref:Toxin-antitoxin system HicB family antitoxin n=1 Tax=Alterisphingorhabdus coralli TaxID=3071408 RepID=A0AA97F845_9SPHN|nr:toxin-antitoxin system HicB family antitoxin [Parasphingorhabdus sp. SCSIO 66989]WOE76169.1 toxin-antitoxin system HicB family antitoxin [Parasphingorhabdus sp. SCSIO 66989]
MPDNSKPAAKKAFALRVDPALHDAIERLAASELRSVNAQIEVLLRDALARRGVKLAPPVRAKRGRPPKREKK